MATFKSNQQSSTANWVEVDERLWLAEDGETLVADGDPKAATLFAVPGQPISVEDAERVGLVKAKAKPASKKSAPSEDKQAKPTGKKG